MATQVQLRGGTTTEHSTFTGAVREVTVDTDKDTLVIHDGATAGGFPLASENGPLKFAGATKLTTTSSGIDVTGTVTADPSLNTILAAISDTSITDNAVDLFIYDTSQDSDGGAWRHRTQHTSWYQELGEFPAVALIVATTSSVTIYNMDSGSPVSYKVYTATATGTDSLVGYQQRPISSVSMLNGVMVVGHSGSNATWSCLMRIDFVAESAWFVTDTAANSRRWAGDFVNGSYVVDTSLNTIASEGVNDVAMTVLPNAPIDSATGLPVPTILVGTSGGISQICDSGTVYDMYSTSESKAINNIAFVNNEFFAFTTSASNTRYFITRLLTADDSSNYYYQMTNYDYSDGRDARPGGLGDVQNLVRVDDGQIVWDTSGGLASHLFDTDSVAYITSDYNTGWMNGDIKGAFVVDTDEGATVTCDDVDATDSGLVTNGTFGSDTDWTKGTGWSIGSGVANPGAGGTFLDQTLTLSTNSIYVLALEISNNTAGGFNIGLDAALSPLFTTNGVHFFTVAASSSSQTLRIFANSGTTGDIDNVSVRLAIPDRSVNNNAIGIHGTLDVDAVATGAELKAISGFGASDYLEQPYNSDFANSTGFGVLVWVEPNKTNTYETVFFTGEDVVVGKSRRLSLKNNNIYFAGYSADFESSMIAADDVWSLVGFYVDSTGSVTMYCNGEVESGSLNGTLLEPTWGSAFIGITSSGHADYFRGKITAARYTTTKISAEEIKRIYESEKPMFNENAACTLNGSSDAVTALAYDDITNVLSVGTSGGRSDFQGLVRVDETTDSITELAAHDGMIVEEY